MEDVISDAANDAEPLAGSIDPVRPWTIRAVSVEVRDMAIGAARKEGLSVGQWLERRIRKWCDADEVDGSKPAGAALVPIRNAPPSTDPYTAAAHMARLALELSHASEEQRKDPLVRSARNTVRAMLTALRTG